MALKRFVVILFIAGITLLSGCGASEDESAFGQAETRLAEGDYQGAAIAFSSFVDEFPESPLAPRAQYMAGLILHRHLKRLEESLSSYAMLFKLFPESEEVFLAKEDIAGLYHGTGDHRRALEVYEWLLEYGPFERRDSYQYSIAGEYIELNDFVQARIELKELLKEVPGTLLKPDILYRVGSTFYLEGRSSEAIAAFDTLIRTYPEHKLSLEAKFSKAAALEEAGLHIEAIALFEGLKKEYNNSEAVKIRIESAKERLKDGPRLRRSRRR